MWDFGKFSSNKAFIDDNGATMTYAELASFCGRFAEAVGSRCLVFCLCENSIGSIAGYAGCLNGRIVPLLLNAHIEAGLLKNLLGIYKPRFIWKPAGTELETDAPLERAGFSEHGYELMRCGSAEYGLYPELGLLLTTSGSTGSQKLVRQSYKNVETNARQIVEYLDISEDERPVTTLPMNYTYGLSIINSHLLAGATVLVTDKSLMQKEFWQFFKEQGATSFGGVPYTYEILDKLRFFKMDLPSLRYMTQAGGKIIPELHRKFAGYADAHGKKFIVMYGQCEATARMGYLPAEKAAEKCGAMGIAIPGGKFSLADADGAEIPDAYVTGELVYEGGNVTLGYAGCTADLAKGDERHGRLLTGDMAERDDDGFYYIVGRKKRFLKVYGNRVNLDELDRMVRARFGGMDCACGGVDDHVYIFVTDRDAMDGVLRYVSEKTGLNRSAFTAVYLDAIPRNDAGKTLYAELGKYYGGDGGGL